MRINVKSSAAALAKKNAQRARDLPSAIRQAMEVQSLKIKTSAILLSSGSIPTSRLSAPLGSSSGFGGKYWGLASRAQYSGGLNNPYGKGPANWRGPRGAMPYPGLPVWNKQSGKVFSSWKTSFGEMSTLEGPTLFMRLSNTDPAAYWLNYGTPRMVPRDLIDKLHQVHDVEFSQAIRKALQKTLKS